MKNDVRSIFLGKTEKFDSVEFPIEGYLFLSGGRKVKDGIKNASIFVCREKTPKDPKKGVLFAGEISIHNTGYNSCEIIGKCGYLPTQIREYLRKIANSICTNY